MAKRTYTNKIAEKAAQFMVQQAPTPQPVAEQEIEKQADMPISLPTAPTEDRREEIQQQSNSQENDRRSILQAFDLDEDLSESVKFSRTTIYLTFEEKAAIDKINYDLGLGKSDIIRQLIDAGMNAVFPGIFEETKAKAEEMRESSLKITKRRKKGNAIYQKLSNKLGG